MTLEQFQAHPPTAQLIWVMTHGTYLAHRWQGQSPITLFHLSLGGDVFFAEVSVSETQDAFVLLRCFDWREPLDAYVGSVRLPE